MEEEVNLNLGWLSGEKVEVHELIMSTEGPVMVIIIHDISPVANLHVVRLFTLMGEEENNEYFIDMEVDSFSFTNEDTAVEFADRLLTMSALEMLNMMALNKKKHEVGLLH
ncbi:hypothetical protein JSQ81_16730 [Sporosarcina sp. Marseille-Q4063]|uniref:hypothetical protein n=1 Tax=Sporosarcina sp. Marseille-Q4063 TaxID=2810514 RepID=UPI001BAFD7B0|nr:hypothetical protein [Sporosarcina sp. Marseille-Q4063]QUW21425.1 hypothetical protein JSQ81_16730 [Sporosarcina sp. Marseille-Q4063]